MAILATEGFNSSFWPSMLKAKYLYHLLSPPLVPQPALIPQEHTSCTLESVDCGNPVTIRTITQHLCLAIQNAQLSVASVMNVLHRLCLF